MLRIDAILSRFGYCSRREAPMWVKAKRVSVNGKICQKPAEKANIADVLIDGEPIEFPEGIFLAYYKPLGLVCSHESRGGNRIYDVLPEAWLRRNPPVTSIGRLDKETSGLLLLTDDGQKVHHWTSPKHHVEKEYEFETEEDIPTQAIEIFASGELLLESEIEPLKPAKLEILSPRHGRLILEEGRYHQVRRMLASQGAPICSLKRTRIGKLKLADLSISPGEWVEISAQDID